MVYLMAHLNFSIHAAQTGEKCHLGTGVIIRHSVYSEKPACDKITFKNSNLDDAKGNNGSESCTNLRNTV